MTADLLTRGVLNIIPDKESLEKKLQSGQKLHIYLGIDPTATHIHLGHAVPLRKLQALAQLGHHVTFLIGDLTALIGDTSDKETERPVLTKEQIEANFQTYKQQAEKVLDFSLVDIKYNSEWLHKLDFVTIIKLCQQFSLNDFISRELIKKRLEQNKHIALHETLYPVMQGYDSYHLRTDLQIGGADQTFNMQAGRTLLKNWDNKESFVLATDYLLGTDGRKMSKSWGNAIWLDDTPEDMYAKVMSISDDLIVQYYTLATDVAMEKITIVAKQLQNGAHPLNSKKELAYQIVAELYDAEKATHAQSFFGQREVEIIKIHPGKMSIETLLIGVHFVGAPSLTKTKAEAKRLVQQGGVYVDNKRVTDIEEVITVQEDMKIQIGKNRVFRLQLIS